jgi:hypothetical protein
MMPPQSKIASSTRETKEGEILSVPILQNQGKDRILTPPPSPEKLQHDLFWRETVLYWNRSDYRWSLIEYIPCLMGIIWEEEKMGRIEKLSSFPMEAQYYFVKGIDLNNLALSSTNYHRLFRTKIAQPTMHLRRMSEPDIGGNRFADPQGITQESFLFGRFLKHVLKTTKISCTVLILSLKFAQQFLHRSRLMGNPYCAGLESNQFRLFVTSLLLADKYSEDHPYTNKSWSSLSGLPVEDINTMERAFLAMMQHGLYTHEVEFREWTKSLQSLCQWNTPNPHHPDNSRILNIAYTSGVRRMSFSHMTEANNSSVSNGGSSISNHIVEKGTSFWSRFAFHRK